MTGKDWLIIGLIIVILGVLYMLRKTLSASAIVAADATAIASNYNALASGAPSVLKDTDLKTFTLLPTKLLSADGTNPL